MATHSPEPAFGLFNCGRWGVLMGGDGLMQSRSVLRSHPWRAERTIHADNGPQGPRC